MFQKFLPRLTATRIRTWNSPTRSSFASTLVPSASRPHKKYIKMNKIKCINDIKLSDICLTIERSNPLNNYIVLRTLTHALIISIVYIFQTLFKFLQSCTSFHFRQ